MTDREVNPARLSGEALRRWYLRSPDDVEQVRQAAATRRYGDFFSSQRPANPNPGLSGGFIAAADNPDPAFGLGTGRPSSEIGPSFGRTPTEASKPQTRQTREIGLASSNPVLLGVPPTAFSNRRINAPAATGVARPVAQVTSTTPANAALARVTAMPIAPTYRAPATPPKPSFSSYLFGGPAPITSPEGNVVGYYDHDAGKAGLKMTGAYASIAPFFIPAGWMEVVGTRASTPLLQAIDRGILESIQQHHPMPLHMGGRDLQELAPLRQSLHTELHRMLRSAFKDAGLPKVGGKGGSKEDWLAYFNANPDSYSKALEVLQRTTREFDKIKGANVSKYLDRELARMAERTLGKGH